MYWYFFIVSVNTKFSPLKFTYALDLSQPTKWGILLFCTIAMMKIAKWIQGSQVWPMSTLNFHSLNSPCLRFISANKMRNFTILYNSNDENCKMNSGKSIMTHVYIKFSELKFTYALDLSQPKKWGTLLFCAIVMMKIAKWIQGSQVWPMSTSNSHCYNLL